MLYTLREPPRGGESDGYASSFGTNGKPSPCTCPRVSTTQPHGDRARPGAGGEARVALHGQVPEHPTPRWYVDEVPATGSRTDRLAGVRPQERGQQHPVDQIVDTAPALPILYVPVPLMGEQLVDVLRFSIRCVLLPSRLSTCPRSLWMS